MRDIESLLKVVVGMSGFKSCPKCGGNIMIDRDHYGWYELCVQCGYLRDLQNVVITRLRMDLKKEAAKIV